MNKKREPPQTLLIHFFHIFVVEESQGWIDIKRAIDFLEHSPYFFRPLPSSNNCQYSFGFRKVLGIFNAQFIIFFIFKIILSSFTLRDSAKDLSTWCLDIRQTFFPLLKRDFCFNFCSVSGAADSAEGLHCLFSVLFFWGELLGV